MKYLVISIAALVLMACVCGGPATTTPVLIISTATPGLESAPVPSEAPAATLMGKVGDTITQGDYSVTVVSIETAASFDDFLAAKSGNTLLAVEVSVLSGANTGVHVSPLYISVRDADGFQYSATLFGKAPGLPTQDDLPKGERVRGWVTVEIPEQARGLILTYEPLFDLDNNIKIRFDLGQ